MEFERNRRIRIVRRERIIQSFPQAASLWREQSLSFLATEKSPKKQCGVEVS
jgi:hypothetical protein